MKIQNHILPKAIRRHNLRLWLATAIAMTATLAALTGCSADNDPQIAAGEDGTSVTFGATIDHREAHGNDKAPASRAITDGTFDDDDRILVHMDGKLKAFVYRTAQGFVHDGTVSASGIDTTPAEWEAGETQKDVLAYGPAMAILYSDNSGYDYRCMAVKDQSNGDNYKYSDDVYAAQTLHRSHPALTFRHGMARIVVRLRPGDSLKDEDVAGATVLLGNENLLMAADIDPQTGTLTAYVPTEEGYLPPQTITPHRCADTPTGFVAAYEALLPPQDVSGKTFIRVRLSDGREREYVAESGSLLEGGHEYVYNATVEADRVTVTISDSDVPWQDGILTTKINGKEFRLIRTAEDLVRFADDVNNGQQNLNALQTADIDLGGIDNWKPIGMQYPGDPRPFLGIYNGNGYTISHLKISDMQDGIAAGLFGRTDSDALLTGIHLRDVKISIRNKASTVGTLVGISRGASTVSLCSAQGIINTSDIEPTVGGLVGLNEGTITRCRTDVEITVDRVRLSGQRSAYAGGIIGRNDYSGLLFACHAIGNITMKGNASNGNPTMRVGGIAGRNEINYTLNSTIHCCIAEGDVSVTSESADIDIYAGGLVGYNDGGDVKSCYARGTAIANTVETPTGKRMAGAIVGYMWNNNVQSCYGAGVGGQGTSNCVGNTYNTTPGEGDIRKIITNSLSTHGTITGYDPLATPAYGIDISRSASVRSSSFWLAGDGTWPVLDFTRNTLN